MKVLVTGATGFIGNYVIETLLSKKITVFATSSNITKAASFSWFDRVRYIEFNFNDFNVEENYFEYFDKPTHLIHLAWEGLPNYKKDFHLTENLPKHSEFLTNLISNGLKDCTLIGTCFEYGMQQGCLSEEMKCFPQNAYAQAKHFLNNAISKIAKDFSCTYKWVRLFYMYGNGQSKNSLISQLEEALKNGDEIFNMSGGEQIRDFLPVEKVAENIVNIALQKKIIGTINCCSGLPIKVKDFVKNYLQNSNKIIKLNLGYYPYADYEPMEFWGSIGKLNLVKNND